MITEILFFVEVFHPYRMKNFHQKKVSTIMT